ncbi:site-specific integrase [Cellulomonas sp. Root485]|uniref:site-specific integrase n=1 Tax=Cellulomonas sp. Root485 TaxID=1736546 RepID=UPI0009E7AC46|nr:site-specific integrase [Cellulomonas sp. Root485]
MTLILPANKSLHQTRSGTECLALRVEDLDLDAISHAHRDRNGREGGRPADETAQAQVGLLPAHHHAADVHRERDPDGAGPWARRWPDDLVFPSTKGSPRSPGRVRDQLRAAQENLGTDVTPHDFRRTVATQVARGSTLAHATALLGHADESTTARHYVQRIHLAPDLRVVPAQLVAQASDEASI